MIRNYFLVAVRNIARYKLFSFINVAGLSIGMAAAVILYLFARYELTYDQRHSRSDRIFLVYKERITPTSVQPTYDTWMPLMNQMKSDFPEVINGTRIYETSALVEVKGSRFNENCYYADPEFFSLFDFPLETGNNQKALPDEKSVVLSKKMARKFFGEMDPVGQVIKVNFSKEYIVTGVLEDFPQNSFFKSELLFPIRSLSDYKEEETNWQSSSYYTFVLLHNDADPQQLLPKFPAFIKKIWDEETQKRTTFKLLPLRATYETFVGDPKDVYILVLVGIGLVIIVSINFVNLSTARSMDRSKEVSMRKVFGAQRFQLISQFLHESVLMSLGALVLSLLFVRLALPFLNEQFELDLQLDLTHPGTYLGLIAFSITLGLLAGSFPSFVLSGLQIERGLKTFKGNKTEFRSVLVAVQFGLSMILVVTMTVIGEQVDFMKSADLGFKSGNQIILPVSVADFPNADEAQMRLQSFKDVLARHSAVKSITSSRHIPTQWTGSNLFVRPEGWQDQPLRMRFTYHDADFLKTYDIPLLQGPGFKDDSFGDQRESAILNESALRAFGWQDIHDKHLMIGDRKIEVVGLIRNFNYETLKEEVAPILHFHRQASNRTHRFITVNVGAGNEETVLSFIKSKWTMLDESGLLPFSYFYLDQNIGRMYQAEDRLFTMIRLFSITILVVACVGLFGLTSFTLEKKKKEIGIRKVLGASVFGIVTMFYRKYATLLLVSFIVSAPVSWILMSRWLAGYARHTDLGWLTFAASFVAIVVIALLAVSAKTVQVALKNPASVIKEE